MLRPSPLSFKSTYVDPDRLRHQRSAAGVRDRPICQISEGNSHSIIRRVAEGLDAGEHPKGHSLPQTEVDAAKMILVSNANNSPADCLSHYEFLRRYMAGDWQLLPKVEWLEGIRRPLLQEFSNNLWTQMTNYLPWDERSVLGRVLSSAALLLISLLWWPEPLQDVAQEPLPVCIRPPPALGGTERAVYVAIAAISTAAWCWPGAGVLARIADMARAM